MIDFRFRKTQDVGADGAAGVGLGVGVGVGAGLFDGGCGCRPAGARPVALAVEPHEPVAAAEPVPQPGNAANNHQPQQRPLPDVQHQHLDRKSVV